MDRRTLLKMGLTGSLAGAVASVATKANAQTAYSGIFGIGQSGGTYEAKDLLSQTTVASGNDAWTVIQSVIGIPGAYVIGGNGTFNLSAPLVFDADHVQYTGSHGHLLQATVSLGFPSSEPVVRIAANGVKYLGTRINAAGYAAGAIDVASRPGAQYAINEINGVYAQAATSYGIRNSGAGNVGAHIIGNRLAVSQTGAGPTNAIELLASDGMCKENELSGYNTSGIVVGGPGWRMNDNHYYAKNGSVASGLVIRAANFLNAHHEYIDFHANGPPVLIQPASTLESVTIESVKILGLPAVDDAYSVFRIDNGAALVRDLTIRGNYGKTNGLRWRYLLEVTSLGNLKSFTFEENKPFRNVARTKNVSPTEWPTKNNRIWNGTQWVGF